MWQLFVQGRFLCGGFCACELITFLFHFLCILCNIVPVTFLISLLFPVNCPFSQPVIFTFYNSSLPPISGSGGAGRGVSESVYSLECFQ